MDGFSTVDGFVEVNECLEEMIKYVANEPSVGLYYVQQHTHNALPNLLRLQDKVVNCSRETTLHTQDLEDSIIMVDSMKHCGLSISNDMVNDINKSLLLISTSQPQRGLLRSSSSSFHAGKGSYGAPTRRHSSVLSEQDAKSGASYFSSVLKSAKQKAGSIKWPQLDREEPIDLLPSELVQAPISTSSDTEPEELPFSSQILDEQLHKTLPTPDFSSASENYEEFKANKEAKLKEWLEQH